MNIKIYGSSYCPFCRAARDFLTDHGVEFENIIIDDPLERQKLYDKLGLVDPNRTVPQIFFGEERIGGWKEFQKSAVAKAIAAGEAPILPAQ